jgi:hypothetical protein
MADILEIMYKERKNLITEEAPTVNLHSLCYAGMQDCCISEELQNLYSSPNVKG